MSFTADLNEIMTTYKGNPDAIQAAKDVLNLVELYFSKTISSVKTHGMKHAAGVGSGVATTPSDPFAAIGQIIAAFPADLRNDFAETVTTILHNIAQNNLDTLLNGVTDAEHAALLVDHYATAFLERHPEADSARLNSDLLAVASIGDRLFCAEVLGRADRFIASRKGA